MLAPLTDLVQECCKTKSTKKNNAKKKPWQRDLIPHQQVFGNIKAAIAKEVVLAYPDFSKSFEIYTDTSATHTWEP